MQRCGRILNDWASIPPVDYTKRPPESNNLRFGILSKKYKNWMKIRPPGQENHIGHDLNCAAYCSETLRAYGYLRGRWIIWRDKVKWDNAIKEDECRRRRQEKKKSES